MPYKHKTCGIYCITTPNGSMYIGSSIQIEQRWAEHRSVLRHHRHHSERLQAAWDKHGEKLSFSVLLECPECDLNKMEQECIDKYRPVLNTSQFVRNIWCDLEVREKLLARFRSPEYRCKRSEIALSSLRWRWRKVDCSDGRSFESMKLAADAFGIKASGIAHLVKTQRTGRLGVRFKFADDEWRADSDSHRVALETRTRHGKIKHTEATKAKLSAKAKARGAHPAFLAGSKVAAEKSRVQVLGRHRETNALISFPSMLHAGRFFRPDKPHTACAQIIKATSGVKKSAYGYIWEKRHAVS